MLGAGPKKREPSFTLEPVYHMHTFQRSIRLAAISFAVGTLTNPTMAANPFLNLTSDEPIVSTWTGTEWGDQIAAAGEEGHPLHANVTTKRLAQMSWGQIVRMRFEAENGRQIPPLYLLVRDDVILELAGEDMEPIIGKIATMTKPPHYDPTDVRASKAAGKTAVNDGQYQVTIETENGMSTYRSSHPSGHFRTLVWQQEFGMREYAMGQGARADGFRLSPTNVLPETDILSVEALGDLTIGMTQEKAISSLGKPAAKKKAVLLEATGDWYSEYTWPAQGLALGMISASPNGPWTVGNIHAEAPCRLSTKAKIHIGSFEADLAKAYRDSRSKDDSVPGETFVAGSIYGGIIFEINAGVVTSIFFGAGAE